MQAIIAKTSASNIFALSSGALVALKTALTPPAIEKAALYEPPLSINGSAPISWIPRYNSEITKGKFAAAAVTAMKGLGTEPVFSKFPRFVIVPLMALIMKVQGESKGDTVTIRSLIPTQHFDMHIVQEMSDTLEDYVSLSIPILLLGGEKSPAFLSVALDELAATLPRAQRKTFPGLGHDGPEDDGRPDLIAKELRHFFTESYFISDRQLDQKRSKILNRST